MKIKLLFLTLFTFAGIKTHAQSQKILARFVVSDARVNKQDLTKHYLDNGAYFAFYTIEGKTDTYFCSRMAVVNSQSYGHIYNIKDEDIPATNTEYHKENLSFKWSFKNSYDKENGTADVKLVLTDKPAGVAFEMTILTEKLDLLVYKGYMQGSLKDIN